MWKEELDSIAKDGGLHYIEYCLKNDNVITFMVTGVRYYGKYCIRAESRTDSVNSYWVERTLTISRIKSIDGVPYDQSIKHLNYIKKEEEKRKKEQDKKISSSNSSSDGKTGCIGFFGTTGFVLGGAIGEGNGFAVILGVIVGVIFAIWFYDLSFGEKIATHFCNQ